MLCMTCTIILYFSAQVNHIPNSSTRCKLSMSHNQNPHQSSCGDHLVNTASSVAVSTNPIRSGTSQDTRLPPISSLFGSDTTKHLTPAMDVDNASKDVNDVPSRNQKIASKAAISSQLRRAHSLARIENQRAADYPLSPSLLGSLTRSCQKVPQPQTSSHQKTLTSYRSHNTGPQRVGSIINGASTAPSGNNFHIATMEGGRMVVNMALVTSASTDSEPVPWEPRKRLNDESPLPLFDGKDRTGKSCGPLSGKVLGKRSNPFSEKEMKRGKCSHGHDLAASLDALAREHARSSMSSSTISIPCPDSKISKPNIAKGDHGGVVSASRVTDSRGRQGNDECLNVCNSKNLELKENAKSELENKTAAEPGKELDFLASVVLSQDHPAESDYRISSSESQEVLSPTKSVSIGDANSLTVHHQRPKLLNEGEEEPRSEASFLQEERSAKLMLNQVIQAQVQGSTGIVDKRIRHMENVPLNRTEAEVNPGRDHECPPDAQNSSLTIFERAKLSKKVGDVGYVIPKCSINYKLKRGPKVKRLDRMNTSNTGKAGRSRETAPKKRNQASSSKVLTNPSQALKGDLTKHGSFTEKDIDVTQPARKSSQPIRSICSLPSSKSSTTSAGGMASNRCPSDQTAPRNVHAQGKTTAREGKLPLVREKLTAAESSLYENDEHGQRQGKPELQDKRDKPHSLAVTAFHPRNPDLEKLRKDQGNGRVKNMPAQTQRKTSPSVNVSANAGASPSLPLEVIIAAAKQSPPYVHKCDQCGSVFNRRFNLNKHIRNVHENIRKFACKTCGELFLQKSHLAAHILAVHDKSRPFRCDLCPKSFSWIGVLRKHKLAIHKVTVQKRVSSTYRQPIPKAIEGKTENADPIHRHQDDANSDSLLSGTQEKIAQTGKGDVLIQQKSKSASLKPQCKL